MAANTDHLIRMPYLQKVYMKGFHPILLSDHTKLFAVSDTMTQVKSSLGRKP
jgi:hypothetical protein